MSIQKVQSAYSALRSPETDTAAAAMSLNDMGIAPQADGQDNTKTPDYHLPFTGDQVVAALWKIINLDLNKVGGVTIIESTVTNPYPLDGLVQIGNYSVYYVSASSLPKELVGVTPLNIKVYTTSDGDVVQIIEGAGAQWYRYTKDKGQTWSDFVKKPLNTPIETDKPVTEDPDPDPFEEVQTDIADIKKEDEQQNTAINSIQDTLKSNLPVVAYLGTEAAGTQILNGTFDFTKPTDKRPVPATAAAPASAPAAEEKKEA